MDPIALLEELIAIPAPPGQEELIVIALQRHLDSLGLEYEVDAKGNLIVTLGDGGGPVVSAHMDEIAMICTGVSFDGCLSVDSLGGLYPWKIGEGPVSILAPGGQIPGILSFGSIHTEDPSSTVEMADDSALKWSMAKVVTGRSIDELDELGVRPGTRVALGPDRRKLTRLGELVAGHFFDDRADLVSWLLALAELKNHNTNATFIATVSEETGGEGALYALRKLLPDVFIALELGPDAPDAPVHLNSHPTVWASDSFSLMKPSDLDFVAAVGNDLGLDLQFQVLSRGGSDASCAASMGLCARPITLGLPMENSHGCEIMHPDAMENLARLTVALVLRLG